MAMNPRLLVPRASYDPDAARYLAAVEAADGQALETPVKTAIDAFFRDLKATPGLFDAIKASCILCGARTITGALVPLAGTAPTPNGFVSGDYSRTDGITGDGTSYLDSNRANDADPQDDSHNAVYVTAANTVSSGSYISAAGGVGANNLLSDATNDRIFTRNRSSGGNFIDITPPPTGLLGTSRNESSEYIVRVSGANTTVSTASDGVASDPVYVFARSFSGSAITITNGTIAFYSIGTSVDLEALDTAVSNLVTAIGNAL